MKNLFELATGEKLTLEALRYYLPSLQRRANACSNTPSGLVLPSKVNAAPDVLLGALADHLNRLENAVYRKSGPNETNLRRKTAIDAELQWFLYNIGDEAGVKIHPTLEVLGMTTAELYGLIIVQLSYTNGDLSAIFSEAEQVTKAFSVLNTVDKLYLPVAPAPLTDADMAFARKWVQRYAAAAFVSAPTPMGEALKTARERAAAMAQTAHRLGRADPDLVTYARNQLIADGRLQLAS